jgi:hypothetical protein
LYLAFRQFGQRFEEHLLHGILCLLFIFQVFHTHTQQQQSIALQQQPQPVVIGRVAVVLQQLFVGMLVLGVDTSDLV